jgi:hypothetical protein
MLDKIAISCKVNRDEFLNSAHQKNIDFNYNISRNSNEKVSFFCKNFHISVIQNWINIRGSISTFYLGQNVTTLKREDLEPAFKLLSNELGIDVSNGLVRNYEISNTFPVKYNAGIYLSMFTDYLKNPPSTQTPNSRYFGEKGHIKLYDKRLQAMKNNIKIPEHLKGKQLLRYEVNKTRGLNKDLNNGNPLMVKDIPKDPFIKLTLDDYLKKFNNIRKLNEKHGAKSKEVTTLIKKYVKNY